MTFPISITIIALNEADRIARAIESVRPLAAEIIVVDSGSTDGTPEIASVLGAHVLHRSWTGYGEQKQFAENSCAHDWVLNIDADEALSPELVQEIQALFANGSPAQSAFRLGMEDMLPGQKKPSRFNYVKWHIRLYNRTRAGFNASTVHDVVEVRAGSVGVLRQHVLHYSARSITHSIEKLNRYSTMQAAHMQAQKKNLQFLSLRLALVLPLAFFKSYVLRKNALLGMPGFVNSVIYAFSRFTRLVKHWEIRR